VGAGLPVTPRPFHTRSFMRDEPPDFRSPEERHPLDNEVYRNRTGSLGPKATFTGRHSSGVVCDESLECTGSVLGNMKPRPEGRGLARLWSFKNRVSVIIHHRYKKRTPYLSQESESAPELRKVAASHHDFPYPSVRQHAAGCRSQHDPAYISQHWFKENTCTSRLEACCFCLSVCLLPQNVPLRAC